MAYITAACHIQLGFPLARRGRDPVVEHTIGLVTSSAHQRQPLIAELMAMFSPLELDALVQPARAMSV